jgi:hypothetical protein
MCIYKPYRRALSVHEKLYTFTPNIWLRCVSVFVFASVCGSSTDNCCLNTYVWLFWVNCYLCVSYRWNVLILISFFIWKSLFHLKLQKISFELVCGCCVSCVIMKARKSDDGLKILLIFFLFTCIIWYITDSIVLAFYTRTNRLWSYFVVFFLNIWKFQWECVVFFCPFSFC